MTTHLDLADALGDEGYAQERTWFCNKCGRVTRGITEQHWHSQTCNYTPVECARTPRPLPALVQIAEGRLRENAWSFTLTYEGWGDGSPAFAMTWYQNVGDAIHNGNGDTELEARALAVIEALKAGKA